MTMTIMNQTRIVQQHITHTLITNQLNKTTNLRREETEEEDEWHTNY